MGYYSQPIVLSLRNHTNYRETITYSLNSQQGYQYVIYQDVVVEMGENQVEVYLATDSNTTAWTTDTVEFQEVQGYYNYSQPHHIALFINY